jgi:hypothetical protein
MTENWVVTSPEDEETQAVARSVPGVRLHVTDGFTRHGAHFNKGLCVETCLDEMGRAGWLAIWDADCLWPDSVPLERLVHGHLHGATRRILEDPSKWHPGLNWNVAPPSRDGGPIGFTQIFAADDPVLQGKPYWYDPTFAHAGGGDARFIEHWPKAKHVILPMEVLHLGPKDSHWFGTDPAAKDMMAAFVTRNGWTRAAAKFTPEQVARAPAFVERVDVPGYAKSEYELPFVRRAQAARGQ